MKLQSNLVIDREVVHDVDLYLSFHGFVLVVYRFFSCRVPLRLSELEVVGGFGGFPRGVFVFPFFCHGVPFFLYLPNSIKSRSQVSRFSCGYVGTILAKCLSVNFLTDFVHSIELVKPVGVPI